MLMTEKTSTEFPDANEETIVSAMVNGVCLHAVHHGKDVPLAAHLQAALKLLPRDIGELGCSAYRHKLINAVQQREPEPSVTEKISRWFGAKAVHPEHSRELSWLEQFGDHSSPTMLALEADLLMSKGDKEGAEERYRQALELVREQGIAFNE